MRVRCQRAKSAGCDRLANASLPLNFKPSKSMHRLNTCCGSAPMVALLWQRRTSEAQLFAHDSSPAEAESSACFRSHAENETLSDRSAEPQPTKFPEVQDDDSPSPLCNSRSVDFSACSSRFKLSALARYPPVAWIDFRTNGKGVEGENSPRRFPVSSTCSSAQRGPTCICPIL